MSNIPDTHVYSVETDLEFLGVDLREEASEEMGRGESVEMASISLIDANGYICTNEERGNALYLPRIGRIGISWGADADWADADSLDAGIRMYVDDPEEYERRN